MKTVSKREAVKTFERLGELAHGGETVLVVDAGKPWAKLVPAARPKRGKSAAEFKARLNRICREPIPGGGSSAARPPLNIYFVTFDQDQFAWARAEGIMRRYSNMMFR